MRYLFALLFITALSTGAYANPDCIQDQYGNVVCGAGQCEVDLYGKVWCAKQGGGALRGKYGNVMCGTGYCVRDNMSDVWCSKEPGGGAAIDLYGKAKCFGGCEAGTTARCEEGR